MFIFFTYILYLFSSLLVLNLFNIHFLHILIYYIFYMFIGHISLFRLPHKLYTFCYIFISSLYALSRIYFTLFALFSTLLTFIHFMFKFCARPNLSSRVRSHARSQLLIYLKPIFLHCFELIFYLHYLYYYYIFVIRPSNCQLRDISYVFGPRICFYYSIF